MASSLIHIAVANEINKDLKRDKRRLLIGSISPDISKEIGQTKLKSHFLDNLDTDIPNIDKFLNKYYKNLNDDFVMGYFIHLYTDYLWFKYFLPEFYDKDMVIKMDGTKVKCVDRMLDQYIYNDYTNLNELIIDRYDLDLKIFYEDLPEFEDIIKEIPMDKLNKIVDKASLIIEKSKITKSFIFDLQYVETFIKTSVDLILAKIDEIKEKV